MGKWKNHFIENLTELFSSSNHKIYSSKQYFDENKTKEVRDSKKCLICFNISEFVFIV